MNLALGIDTGGTYTDAVLVDHERGLVLAGAKALTTRHDLALGIEGAIRQVFTAAAEAGLALTPSHVTLVALSTTLATNTLAEGHRGAVCLLLIGYDEDLIRQFGFRRDLAAEDVVYISGGHDELGNEAAPLDEAALVAAITARRQTVEAFAISGYFGVRNPAHELRARQLVTELTELPVTCGHDLTTRLNSVRRATTASLNAHLILPLRELIGSVQRPLAGFRIEAPLMVVKGDGSLVRAEWAMERPIETILSGPAASAVGAWHLAGRRDVWVVDVGGTTTDIAALREGWPLLNPDGAQVAGWRTMVEAVDVHTVGLGGDSHVRFDGMDRLLIGPRRVAPLSLLASQYPDILPELRRQAALPWDKRGRDAAEFLLRGRQPGSRLSESDREVLDRLAGGPQSPAMLVQQTGNGLIHLRLADLEGRALVRRAGFTPTDALHVLGRFDRWNLEAAWLGAEALAARAGMAVEAFCERVVATVAERVATELVSKVLADEATAPNWEKEPAAKELLRRGLRGGQGQGLAVALALQQPLVAIGAPVAAYMPQVAEDLHTDLVIPDHAEVANAVGAVAGGIILRRRLLINPLDEVTVRLHLEDGVHDFRGVEAAVAHAQALMLPQIEEMARQAGAEEIVTQMRRQDHIARVAGALDGEVYLGTELFFTAAGRPSPARPSVDRHPADLIQG